MDVADRKWVGEFLRHGSGPRFPPLTESFRTQCHLIPLPRVSAPTSVVTAPENRLEGPGAAEETTAQLVLAYVSTTSHLSYDSRAGGHLVSHRAADPHRPASKMTLTRLSW